VLASGSPRRRDLLKDHFSLAIRVPQTDESPRKGESPLAYVRRVARNKWRACLVQFPREFQGGAKIVVSADTIVALGSRILGKPRSRGDAVEMLSQLSGRKHRVITAVCSGWSDQEPKIVQVTSFVRFRNLSQDELNAYLKTGEWRDKAGAYAIQGKAFRLVDRLEGSLSNVVGLPVQETKSLIVKLLSRPR
jgi:septum formation protein